jgi:hypothetical protein
VICGPTGVGVGVPVGAGVGVGVVRLVRTRVTTTILSGHPAAEKVMFWVYVPTPKPSVCGVKVVEVPLTPPVGAALNQGEVSKLVQAAPVDGVTCILCGGGNAPPAIPLNVMAVGLTTICGPAGVGVGVAVGTGVAVGAGVGVPAEVRIRVTTTTLSGHPAAEKVMFWVKVPAGKPSVCGVKVVEVPLGPSVGTASNQGEASALVQEAPFEAVI